MRVWVRSVGSTNHNLYLSTSTSNEPAGLEEHGPSNDYSFASLGGLRPGANLEREAESAATTAFEVSTMSSTSPAITLHYAVDVRHWAPSGHLKPCQIQTLYPDPKT